MPVPNISTLYQKIRKGAEGGHEFARFMNLLLLAEGREIGSLVKISSDSIGDYKGVDCIFEHRLPYKDFHVYEGYQYKFFPSNLSSSHKSDIQKSLETAIEKFPEMDSWVLVTPEDFNKRDMEWFDNLIKEYSRTYSLEEKAGLFFSGNMEKEFSIYHVGHTQIIEMALKHFHIGEKYFPELFSAKANKIELSKLSVDTINTNWFRGEANNVFCLRAFHDGIRKSNELIFDFQFQNNTPKIYHLHKIDICLVDVWTELKGFPSEVILKSFGEIEYEIDFSRPVNSVILDEILGGPIIFNPTSSIRFGLHLLNFTKKCPGNMVKIQFDFVFDSRSVKSDIIKLDFC